jgi:hypothetical protein
MSNAPESTSRPVRLVVLLQRPHEAPGRPAPALLGPCDAAALSAAVRLRDRLGGTLAALVMGPDEHQQPVLAAAAQAGCDRTVRVHAPDCDGLDYLGAATVLAAAVRRLGCDLLLCGDTGENERTGATGPAVAELLGFAHLTGVLAVDVDGGATAAATDDAAGDAAERSTAGATEGSLVVAHHGNGRIHRLRWPLPAALCLLAPVSVPVSDTAATGERPGSDGATHAPQVETLGLDELGLHDRALAHRRRLLGPADLDAGRRAMLVASADDLVSRLVADGMLP